MNNHEGIPKKEGGMERIPSREDVLGQIEKRCEGKKVDVFNERADQEGVYLLEARVSGEKPGESIEYVYQRKGVLPGKNEAANTILEKVYCMDGIPCGGDIVAEHDDATGEWTEK